MVMVLSSGNLVKKNVRNCCSADRRLYRLWNYLFKLFCPELGTAFNVAAALRSDLELACVGHLEYSFLGVLTIENVNPFNLELETLLSVEDVEYVLFSGKTNNEVCYGGVVFILVADDTFAWPSSAGSAYHRQVA
jgi:hypothetical protein